MRLALLALGLGFAFLGTATAQRPTTTHEDVPPALRRLHSQAWTDRSRAFEDSAALLASGKQTPGEVDKLRVGLIELLATENVQTRILAKQDASEEDTEEYSEYYADLVGAVANLKDERAIPSLLGAADSGGMATRGIARFGKKALSPVLEQVNSRDSNLASGAVFAIREMLAMHTVTDPNSLLNIETALRLALASPNFGVRESAIYAIEYSNDRQKFVPALNDIAEHDPFKMTDTRSDSEGNNSGFYPVRNDAKNLLRKIAEHEPPAIDKGVRQ